MAEPAPTAHLLYDPSDNAVVERFRRGLERFSKPPWTRRAIDVAPLGIDDLSDDAAAPSQRSVAPDGNVEPDDSAAGPRLVLFASERAAASPQVGTRLEQWLSAHGAESILPVVIGSGWAWDTDRGDFRWSDPASVACVPPVLRGAFASEPRHLELPVDSDPRHYSLRNPTFRDQLAEIAAPIRGCSKDDLEDADSRRQRRRRRIVATVSVLLLAFGVAAGALAVLAVAARNDSLRQRDAAIAAANDADEQTRIATAQRLASLVLTDQITDRRLRGLLAATAYDLERTVATTAALARAIELPEDAFDSEPSPTAPELIDYSVDGVQERTARSESVPLSGPLLLDAEGRAVFQSAVVAGQPITLYRVEGGQLPVETIAVDGVAGIHALGGDGTLVVATRIASGDAEQELFAYPEAAEIWTDETRTAEELRPADGPWSCRVLGGITCAETVLLNLATGAEHVLPTELGFRAVAPPLESEPGWPDPVSQFLFTTDGRYLVSFDELGDLVFATSVETGRTIPVVAGGNHRISDFGLVDDQTGWRLYGTTLELFALASGEVERVHDLAFLGQPIAADIDRSSTRAIVGITPSEFVLVDLMSSTILQRRATGERAEEIAIGPEGRWAAIGGGGGAHLVDVATLTNMTTVGTSFFGNEFAPDQARFAFDPHGNRVAILPVNQPFDAVTMIDLVVDNWYEAACELGGGEGLTTTEWERYVGLPTREAACGEPPSPAGPRVTDTRSEALGSTDATGAESAEPGQGEVGVGPGGAETNAPDGADDPTEPADTTDRPRTDATAASGIELRSDGLGVVAFGSDEQAVVDALTPLLGEPTGRFVCRVTEPESGCGPHEPQGIFLSWPNLRIDIPDQFGTFAGYSYFTSEGESAEPYQTPAGITVGSPLSDVVAAHSGLETIQGCDENEYTPIFGPVTPDMTDGEAIDFDGRFSFWVADGLVAGINSGTADWFRFWIYIGCGP